MQQDWNASLYAKFSKEQEKWAKELIKKLAINGDEDILDIGCGDGKITNQLSKITSGTVVGIDKSASMIQLASQKYPHIKFIIMDATKMKFENEFDIIFSNAVLHWIFDHKSLLKRIKKAIKPGGKILLQFGGKGNANKVIETLYSIIKKAHYAEFFEDFTFPYYFPSKKEYENLIEEVGFKKYKIVMIPKKMIHKNEIEFKGWIETTWFPFFSHLPLYKKQSFINEFVKTYIDKHTKNEEIIVDMKRIEVYIEA